MRSAPMREYADATMCDTSIGSFMPSLSKRTSSSKDCALRSARFCRRGPIRGTQQQNKKNQKQVSVNARSGPVRVCDTDKCRQHGDTEVLMVLVWERHEQRERTMSAADCARERAVCVWLANSVRMLISISVNGYGPASVSTEPSYITNDRLLMPYIHTVVIEPNRSGERGAGSRANEGSDEKGGAHMV